MQKTIKAKPSRATCGLIDTLIKIPLFDKISGAELRTIVGFLNTLDVKRGEYVFQEGEKGEYMCFVAEGTFDVIKKSVNGDQVVISQLRSGQSFGEMAVIDSFPRSAGIRATTPGTIVTLSRDSFQSILTQHPAIGIKLFQSLARLLCLHLRKISSGFADQIAQQDHS